MRQGLTLGLWLVLAAATSVLAWTIPTHGDTARRQADEAVPGTSSAPTYAAFAAGAAAQVDRLVLDAVASRGLDPAPCVMTRFFSAT